MDMSIKFLDYSPYPSKPQVAIRATYKLAIKDIKTEGVKVLLCPLFEALDGKIEADYATRVEPSLDIGQKMVLQLKRLLDQKL